jgi:hypothetical protein
MPSPPSNTFTFQYCRMQGALLLRIMLQVVRWRVVADFQTLEHQLFRKNLA